jgi:hypothetical protein
VTEAKKSPIRPATSPVRYSSTTETTSVTTSPNIKAPFNDGPKTVSKKITNTVYISSVPSEPKENGKQPNYKVSQAVISPEVIISPEQSKDGNSNIPTRPSEFVNSHKLNLSTVNNEKCSSSTAAISVLKSKNPSAPARPALPVQPRSATLPRPQPASPSRPSSLPIRASQTDTVRSLTVQHLSNDASISSLENEAISPFEEPSLTSLVKQYIGEYDGNSSLSENM